MVNYFSWTLLPGRCVLCSAAGDRADLCAACSADLPRIEHACGQCGLPLPGAGISHCGRCLKRPPPFQRCVGPLRYTAPVSQLITAFKYRGKLSYGRALALQLADYLRDNADPGAIDVLLPVPLHWRRRWQRGFNQAEVIADTLSRSLKLPLQTRLLRRRRATPPQQDLDARARAANLRDVFQVRGQKLAGLRVALIDDVVTTGATAAEVSRTLLRAGVESVEVWCLARTPL